MSLKKFFQKIGKFFKNLFNGLLPELKRAIHVGVTVTDEIKKFDIKNGHVIDIFIALTKSNIDNKVIDLMRDKLPVIMQELKLVDATLGLTDPEEILAAAIKTIQQLSGDYRSATLNTISIIIAQVAADGKLDWNDAVYLLKWYYDHQQEIAQAA